jgi:hypothetical protein
MARMLVLYYGMYGHIGAMAQAEGVRAGRPPVTDADLSLRRQLILKHEFSLALLPRLSVLAVLALVESVSHQRLLFASLASSAILIYLEPQHVANSVQTLLIALLVAAVIGALTHWLFGSGH